MSTNKTLGLKGSLSLLVMAVTFGVLPTNAIAERLPVFEWLSDQVGAVEIFVTPWVSAGPRVSVEDITSVATKVSNIRTSSSASSFVRRFERFIGQCDEPEDRQELSGSLRFRMDLVSPDRSLLGMIVSNGNEVFLINRFNHEPDLFLGCSNQTFKFVFGLGDLGTLDEAAAISELIEELREVAR
ncbi:hypothetical protein [Wenzhouxiangella marina]|uniref:hypothetical protein n=1 Tax=Wenzhouxiangella marina TaxID=1579979 RepID=UPI0012E10F6E|nr:hypothetical protein [Wenzhouxiangella marina]MBB6086408.1 hypothetical protein [Wenzhouxiangella marina]